MERKKRGERERRGSERERERDEESMREREGEREGDWVRERERLKERERERDEESMRIGKERKRAKRDRNSNILGVVRKYPIGRNWERKGSAMNVNISVGSCYLYLKSPHIRKN